MSSGRLVVPFSTRTRQDASFNVASKKLKHARPNPSTDSNVASTAKPLPVVPDETGSTVAAVEFRDRFSEKRWLKIVILIAAVWWTALSLLGFFSANPTTVNRQQIVDSDLVVAVTVLDPVRGLVEVTQQWIDPNPQTRLTVSGLDEFELNQGDTVVLPLSGGIDGTFHLTRVQHTKTQPDGTTYIYPATEDVFRQVAEFAVIQQ